MICCDCSTILIEKVNRVLVDHDSIEVSSCQQCAIENDISYYIPYLDINVNIDHECYKMDFEDIEKWQNEEYENPSYWEDVEDDEE